MKRGIYQHTENVSLDIAPNGLYIMVCYEDYFSLWTIKGILLCTIIIVVAILYIFCGRIHVCVNFLV